MRLLERSHRLVGMALKQQRVGEAPVDQRLIGRIGAGRGKLSKGRVDQLGAACVRLGQRLAAEREEEGAGQGAVGERDQAGGENKHEARECPATYGKQVRLRTLSGCVADLW